MIILSIGKDIKAVDSWKISATISVVFVGLIWALGENLKHFIETLLPARGFMVFLEAPCKG